MRYAVTSPPLPSLSRRNPQGVAGWCGHPACRCIVAIFVMLAAGFLAASSARAQDAERKQTPFGAAVEVKRILTEVRVVDYDGTPVLGLAPEDFRVKVSGKIAEVRSVLWIPSTTEALEAPAGAPGGG